MDSSLPSPHVSNTGFPSRDDLETAMMSLHLLEDLAVTSIHTLLAFGPVKPAGSLFGQQCCP